MITVIINLLVVINNYLHANEYEQLPIKEAEYLPAKDLPAKSLKTFDKSAGIQKKYVNSDFCNDILACEQKLFDYINEYRMQNNIPALEWDWQISSLAREHSLQMAKIKVMSHDGYLERFQRMGGEYWSKAENVAMNAGQADPIRSAVNQWINSEGHKKNMLGDFTSSGIGIGVDNDGAFYFTQLFGKKHR